MQALLAPATALAPAQPPAAPRQDPTGAFAAPAALQDTLRATFQQATVTALAIPPETVTIAPDQGSVTFLEVESTLEPRTVAQHTRVYRTTWGLSRVGAGVVRVGISAVRREGPLVEVMTAGLLVAGPPQPLTVRAPTTAFTLAAVEVPGPAAGTVQRVAATRGQVQETFTASVGAVLQALPVRALSTNGEALVFQHRYRLHYVREGIAQRVVGTGTTRFLAVTVAPDGTVWAGGDGGGRLYQVAPGSATAQFRGPLLADATGRVEDLVVDARGALLATVSFAGLNNASDLGRLDPATGVLTRLGPTGFSTLFGVQLDPAFRTLYAITGAQMPPVLLALDPATGKGTAIARTDLPTQATSLAFLADGRLIVGGDDGNLYELDPVTGASRLIGPTGVEQVSGMSLRVLR